MSGEHDKNSPESASNPAGCRISRLERNIAGQLVAHVNDSDSPIVDVRLARCFPWTLPDIYISVRDKNGNEIALLDSLDDLDPASRSVAEAELRDKVFNPKITRVLKHKHEFGISSMTAETDRGEVIFQFSGSDDVRILSPSRALFRDVDGNTYEVEDLGALDRASQKYLQPFF